ncbi:MAG TPA: methyltransferase domain-containing protein [Blastocatellia bacterium]|nr:methyltransferase domain-containing protein [Blastocatellia bacterium]
MTKEEVLNTYDDSYARRYDRTFLLNPEYQFRDKAQFEVRFLKELTSRARSWLDVACGTGYFLQQARGNSDLKCMGLDLSPAMLAEARHANPDLEFVEADFLQPQPSFEGRWEVVTCMWGAYGLQETLADVETLIENLAKWTTPKGTCFVPIFDLTIFDERRANGTLMKGVEIDLDRYCWSFVEPDGKRHREMLAPPVSVMTAIFERHFGSIESFPYPDASGMIGIIARKNGPRETANSSPP